MPHLYFTFMQAACVTSNTYKLLLIKSCSFYNSSTLWPKLCVANQLFKDTVYKINYWLAKCLWGDVRRLACRGSMGRLGEHRIGWGDWTWVQQVSALRPIRECLYLCACFVVSRGTGEQRERGPTRSVPEIACRGSPNARTLLDITFNFSLCFSLCFVLLRFAIKTLPVREDELWPPCALWTCYTYLIILLR